MGQSSGLRGRSGLPKSGRLHHCLTTTILSGSIIPHSILLYLCWLMGNMFNHHRLIESKTSLLQFKKGEVYENDSCTICIADFEENDGKL